MFFFSIFRKQEKELRQKEKEARKMEEKSAKKQSKEAAKLEKLYRNTISRSSERVASRSGSLERRRSGDGEMVVLNQWPRSALLHVPDAKTFLQTHHAHCPIS